VISVAFAGQSFG